MCGGRGGGGGADNGHVFHCNDYVLSCLNGRNVGSFVTLK